LKALEEAMAYRLRDRNRQIPNGLTFLQPQTNWRPSRFASFTTIVNALISHRKANPHLISQHKLSVDLAQVADEVDAFNALHCARHGWMAYITDGMENASPPPKPQALLQQERSALAAAADKAKKIWGGIRTLNDWIDTGTPPVPKEQAEARAAVCAVCPKNGKGDFTGWFTKPASEVITKQLERLSVLKLSTSQDKEINLCEVCLCPLKLKVHTPIKHIKEHMAGPVIIELKAVPNCWIPKELDA